MRILLIGDLHLPAVHPAYLQFCLDTYDYWDCDDAISVGDVYDLHSLSRYPKHLRAVGPYEELEQAREHAAEWYEFFPRLHITEGNHDRRSKARAVEAGLPYEEVLRTYNEIFYTYDWVWHEGEEQNWTEVDGVHIMHGDEYGGKYAAANAAADLGVSVAMGHLHTLAGVFHIKTKLGSRFGMSVGCGVDVRHPYLAYAAAHRFKSILGCGVLDDGVPHFIPMPHEKGDLYHRSNFE